MMQHSMSHYVLTDVIFLSKKAAVMDMIEQTPL
jgi:hypothetical protein